MYVECDRWASSGVGPSMLQAIRLSARLVSVNSNFQGVAVCSLYSVLSLSVCVCVCVCVLTQCSVDG